jgi:hypothetical protein
MSNNLVNIHTSAKFYYHSHPPFTLPNKGIRSSSLRGTNIYKLNNSLPYLSCQPMGGFEPDLNYFLNHKQSAATAGRVEPQLNGFCNQKHQKGKPQLNGFSSTISNAPKVGAELESNCSRTAVNQAKILFQHKNLPPLNPITNKKINQQKIHIGFGGGARRAVGAVGVEL